jgi:hypothetical protein
MEMEDSRLCNSIPFHHRRVMEPMEFSLLCNSILGSLTKGAHPSAEEGHSSVGADTHLGEVVVLVVAGIVGS